MKRLVIIIGGLGLFAMIGTVCVSRFNPCPLRVSDTVISSGFDGAQPVGNHFESLSSDTVSASSAGHISSIAGLTSAEVGDSIRRLREGDRQRDLARQFLSELFENNPASAAEFIRHLPAPLDSQMGSALASMWGPKDPVATLEWATNLPPGPVRSQALFSFCGDWASLDPRGAAEFVVNSADNDFPLENPASERAGDAHLDVSSRMRSQMLEIIAARWTAADPDGAIAWATQLPTGNSRDAFVAGLSSTLGETAPVQAAELVAGMTAGPRQSNAALTVLLEWGRDDLAGAADWLKLFPSGDFRDKGLISLTDNTSERDVESVKNLLLAWPALDERAKAIRHYLTQTSSMDPVQGTELLAGIEDISLRQEEAERVAQHRLTKDSIQAGE
jgi:hypothetical protein